YFILIFLFFLVPPLSPPGLYTLSLHDALPISGSSPVRGSATSWAGRRGDNAGFNRGGSVSVMLRPRLGEPTPDVSGAIVPTLVRSEEHTSELQSLRHLVCRLLLEKKKKQENST